MTRLGWSACALLVALSVVAPLEGATQQGKPQPARAGPEQVAKNGTGARGLSLESLLGKLKVPGEHTKADTLESGDSTSTTRLVERLGFKFELHQCHSADGYTTQLVRIVNPHIDDSLRRKVPVVLYAGQGTSPAAFLVGALQIEAEANKSHSAHNWHPGSYAEHDEAHLVGDFHEQVASSAANRSLAAMLSNSGFDVWLVPARGVDAQNRARNFSAGGKSSCGLQAEAASSGAGLKKGLFKRSLEVKEAKLGKKLEEAKQLMAEIKEKNKPKFVESKLPDLGGIDLSDMKLDLFAKLRELLQSFTAKSYWPFSNDEIIEKEFACQLELVRSVSGAEKISLVSYSNGGFVTFGFMSRHTAWARQHLDVVVALAPAVFVNKFNVVLNLAGAASQVSLFDAPFPQDQLGALGKRLCLQEPIRSSACVALIEQLFGPSESFAAKASGCLPAAELNYALEHYLLRALSAPALRQALQVAHAGRMQQYDQGLVGNLVAYKQHKPPGYHLERVNHERLYVVSGQRDAFVDQSSMVLLVGSLGCKPEAWFKKAHYNHLDLLLGPNVDREVNLPVARILLDRDIEIDYYRETTNGDQEVEVNGAGHDKDAHQETSSEHQAGEHEHDRHGVSDEGHHGYEGHTASHHEGKSYDVEGHESDEPQVEQSARRPVRVAAAGASRGSR